MEEIKSLSPWIRQLWDRSSQSEKSSSVAKALTGSFRTVADGTEQSDGSDGGDVFDSEVDLRNDIDPCSTKLDPKRGWPIDPCLYPHVRACLSDIEFEDPEIAARDTGLSVCTLGTGAGNATRTRSNTCTVVRNGSYSYLIDAGEGLQRQFLSSRLSYRDVRKIFITHMHGDHVFGLPGFLLNVQVSSLNANKVHTVEIYGPVGLYNFIATALSLTNTELRKLTVEVYELQGGTQRSMRSAANRKTFPEFHHKVSRQSIAHTM
jgi:hypothetical protein